MLKYQFFSGIGPRTTGGPFNGQCLHQFKGQRGYESQCKNKYIYIKFYLLSCTRQKLYTVCYNYYIPLIHDVLNNIEYISIIFLYRIRLYILYVNFNYFSTKKKKSIKPI